MKQVASLVKRNIQVYSRNRMNIISSLFTMVIIIVLMTVFLGDSATSSITSFLKEFDPARDAVQDKLNAGIYILNWIVAGILLVNSVTISFAVVGIMIEDKENNKLNSMYVAPMKRSSFVFAYVITGFIVTFIMCLLTLGFSEAIIVANGGAMLTAVELLKVIGVLAISVFVFSSFSFLCVLAVNTSSSFSHLGGLIGTLVGFLAAIYIPIGQMPESVTKVIKYLPTLSGSSLFRELFTKDISAKLFSGVPADMVNEVNKEFGVSLYYGDNEASFLLRLLILTVSGIIFLGIAIAIMRKKHLADR
ncbi:MAG: ABC transporter permease [bacterium]|nr:ABC transporter permease [bacterium]